MKFNVTIVKLAKFPSQNEVYSTGNLVERKGYKNVKEPALKQQQQQISLIGKCSQRFLSFFLAILISLRLQMLAKNLKSYNVIRFVNGVRLYGFLKTSMLAFWNKNLLHQLDHRHCELQKLVYLSHKP